MSDNKLTTPMQVLELIASTQVAVGDVIATLVEHARLLTKLHTLCIHPDYEYNNPGQEEPIPDGSVLITPNGDGWMRNPSREIAVNDEFMEWSRTNGRSVFTIKPICWMRLRPVSKTVQFIIHEYAKTHVVKNPLARSTYIEQLRSRVNKGWMPSSVSAAESNNKPIYLDTLTIHDLPSATNYYTYDSEAAVGRGLPEIESLPLPEEFYRHETHYVGIHLEESGVEILTNLHTELTYVRFKHKDGTWLKWHKWLTNEKISISVTELRQQLTVCL